MIASAVEQYDFATLRQFLQLFPEAARTNLIKGYFGYASIPLTDNSDGDEEGEPHSNGDSIEGYVDMIIVSTQPRSEIFALTLPQDAFAALPDSVIAHHVMTEVHETEGDLENIIKVAESGLEVARRAEQSTGKTLPLCVPSQCDMRLLIPSA